MLYGRPLFLQTFAGIPELPIHTSWTFAILAKAISIGLIVGVLFLIDPVEAQRAE